MAAAAKTRTEVEQVRRMASVPTAAPAPHYCALVLPRSRNQPYLIILETPQPQEQCERACLQHLQPLGAFSPRERSALEEAGVFNEEGEIRLLRERHAAYVSKGLRYLGPGFICLDARWVGG